MKSDVQNNKEIEDNKAPHEKKKGGSSRVTISKSIQTIKITDQIIN